MLDAMRFVLALWVTIGHYEVFPLFAWVDATTRVGRFLTHAWSSIVFGTPAVIVFFGATRARREIVAGWIPAGEKASTV